MKRILLALFIIPLTFYGQVSIDSSAMPSNGDTIRFSVAALDTAVLLNYQNSGPNQTWNFDSLVPLRQGLSEFINSNQTPYTAIPLRIGEKLADTVALGGVNLYDVYNFYNNSSSEFALEYRGASLPTGLPFPFPATFQIDDPFTDKDEIYQFPLNYLDRDSSTYNYVFTSPLPLILNAYYGSSGYRINEADAWGSLTTPFGTFNCLRVITDIVGYDTIQFDTNGFGISSHRREYKWLNPNEKIPILTINGVVTAGVFLPTLVQYRDSVRPGVPNLFSPIALFIADTTNGEIGDTFNINNATISLTPSTYNWDIQPNTFQYTNNTNSSSENISLIFNQTGLYSVRLIATNGFGSDTLLLNDYIQINNSSASQLPTAAFSSFIRNILIGDSILFFNRSINDTASLWQVSPNTHYFANGTDSISNSPTIAFTDTGFYTITLISLNSFGSDTLIRTNYIWVDGITGINELRLLKDLKVYPNPIKRGEILSISFTTEKSIDNVSLFDISGKMIRNFNFTAWQKGIEVQTPNDINPGIYFLSLEVNNQRSFHKIIIQ